jgi:hypothetical protein
MNLALWVPSRSLHLLEERRKDPSFQSKALVLLGRFVVHPHNWEESQFADWNRMDLRIKLLQELSHILLLVVILLEILQVSNPSILHFCSKYFNNFVKSYLQKLQLVPRIENLLHLVDIALWWWQQKPQKLTRGFYP